MNSFDSRSPDWLGADEPLPLEVLDAIRVADREDGCADQVARLEARLAPLLQTPHGTPSLVPKTALRSPARGHASTSSSLGTLKLAAVGAALVGIAVLMWPQGKSPSKPVSSVQHGAREPVSVLTASQSSRHDAALAGQSAREDAVAQGAREAAAQPAEPPFVLAASLDGPLQPTQVAKPQSTLAAAARAVPQNSLALEARLLSRARRSLESNPEQALQLAERHHFRFPHGVLSEEREAIAIKALRRTGKEVLASQRQARFLARYPESPHALSLAQSARP